MIPVTALNSIFGWNAGFAIQAYSERMEIHAGTFWHEAGTEFRSLNNATLAWGLRYHPLTTANYYWSSWLYRNPRTGLFFYGTPVISPNHIGPPNYNATHRGVGWIHTHEITGNIRIDNAREYFSGVQSGGNSGDGWLVNSINHGRLQGFLVTPSGVMRRLDPSWQYDINVRRIPNDNPAVSIVLEDIFSRQR